MPAVPILKPREVVRAFEKLGWESLDNEEVILFSLRKENQQPFQFLIILK
jgi:hypothetical protein